MLEDEIFKTKELISTFDIDNLINNTEAFNKFLLELLSDMNKTSIATIEELSKLRESLKELENIKVELVPPLLRKIARI